MKLKTKDGTTVVVQCPRCGEGNVENISFIQWYPEYSNLHHEEDGTLTVNAMDGEIYYDGGSKDGQLQCDSCGQQWAVPKCLDPLINWE